MSLSQHRKRRGLRTQRVVAEWWQKHGQPFCFSVGSGEPGKDIQNLYGHSCEVKARRGFSPLAALKQAEANAEPYDIPYAVLRMDGQGEQVEEWIAVFRFGNIAPLLPGYREPR